MTRYKKLVIGAATVLAIGAAGTGVAVATSGDDDATDTPISGPALDRASRTALDHVGEGTVTETETGDEESYYEVEVTRGDGSQVDVQLDRDFSVVGDETDSENDG